MPAKSKTTHRYFSSKEALAAWAHELGKAVQPGLLIALNGELGTGKTTFVRELVWGMAANLPDEAREELQREVHSPTFVLVHEYGTEIPAIHFDLYRLEGRTAEAVDAALEHLAFRDYLNGENIVLVEWFNRLGKTNFTPDLILEFAFLPDPAKDTARNVTISANEVALRQLPAQILATSKK